MISASAVSEKIFAIIDYPIKVTNGTKNANNVTGEVKFIDV